VRKRLLLPSVRSSSLRMHHRTTMFPDTAACSVDMLYLAFLLSTLSLNWGWDVATTRVRVIVVRRCQTRPDTLLDSDLHCHRNALLEACSAEHNSEGECSEGGHGQPRGGAVD